ncbi:MAG: diaminopimelate epimerase [Alphaproteobacteria bacterium]|nr:diaminopimelate epimerase [Alphaproteobacteria bacterium]
MTLSFLKMHGLGNDFVVIDGRATDITPSEKFLRAVSSRHRGIGCDQCIILRQPKSAGADIFMSIYNADGSQVGACGNATRCVASLIFKELGRSKAVIETVSGLLPVWEESPGLIAVDFGAPRLEWNQIPLAREMDTALVPVTSGGLAGPCCVSVGNPHAVFFVPDAEAVALEQVGPVLEHDALFPERCNIEVAQILAPDRIRMRVWERGTGITEACGSGACATLVAAVRRGLSDRRATIILDGGELVIEWRADNHVIMMGPAALSFRGELAADFSV